MVERELSGYTPKVEVVFTANQDRPFGVNRTATGWQLSVNKTHFESKGFLPQEIEGAVFLEEERLGMQVGQTSSSAIAGLRRWQQVAGQSPHAITFKGAFERLAALSSLEEKDAHKSQLARKYLEKLALRSPGPTNTDQLFSALLMTGLGNDVTPDTKAVERVINNLKKPENVEGRQVSPLDALVSPDLSFTSKASWLENRFLPRLEFLERQDRLRREQEEKKQEEQPKDTKQQQDQAPTPSPAQDEYEQHRGREEKGKGTPTFVIDPSFTGYWEEDSFDFIDEQTGRLVKSQTQRIRTATSLQGQSTDGTKRTISGNTGIDLFSLPLVSGFQLTPEGLVSLRAQGVEVFSDIEGHTFLQSSSNIKIAAEIAMSANLSNFGINSKNNETFDQAFPQEIEQVLFRIRSLPIDALEKIQEWKDFIGSSFKYPEDTQVEQMYASVDRSSSRLTAMTESKLLDCYLAREFFISGLKRLSLEDVQWRAVNGHYVAGSQKDGTAHIGSGTGHAWVKVRVSNERSWIIFDPTPPGDPVRKGEGAIEESEGTSQLLSGEDLDELEKESSNNFKNPSETQDHYLLQFANEAGISPTEAKSILSTLAQVDQLKDSLGRNLLTRLKEQFDRIIEKYTVTRQENLGVVEMSRGQSLDDPVAALIDLRGGSSDPLGFERKKLVEETESYYGGWDLEIVADGSGSMNNSLGARKKYMVQRDMSYLLHRALHRFSQEAQRRKLRLVTPLKIRSSQYMFRGNEIEVIKPLTDEFTPPQMAVLWKKSAENVGGGTPAHLGLKAVLERIPPNEVKLLQGKQLLKVVALISDGGYDDPSEVRSLINRLEALNVIVAEFRITDQRSLDDLPENVAAKVIEEASALMRERVKKK